MRTTLLSLVDVIRAKIAFRGVKNCVWVFGSARLKPGNHYYKKAVLLGEKLAEAGIPAMTGAGGGIMAAVSKGAHSKGGQVVGLGIDIPFELTAPVYQSKFMIFKYFFTRKLTGVSKAKAFVAFPGGFGTMDEIFEVITLMQCGKTPKRPVLVYDRAFWSKLVKWVEVSQAGTGTVSLQEVREYLVIVNDLDKLVKLCKEQEDK